MMIIGCDLHTAGGPGLISLPQPGKGVPHPSVYEGWELRLLTQ